LCVKVPATRVPALAPNMSNGSSHLTLVVIFFMAVVLINEMKTFSQLHKALPDFSC
jgi:hypothetical protein